MSFLIHRFAPTFATKTNTVPLPIASSQKRDTPPTLKITTHQDPKDHILHKNVVLAAIQTAVIAISLVLAIVAYSKASATSGPVETITCLDDASNGNCPPDNPLPNTLYVYRPIIFNNTYLMQPTPQGGFSLSLIVSPTLTIPVALYLPGNAAVINSVDPSLALNNTVVIAPLQTPSIGPEYIITASYAFAGQQATTSTACRTGNTSMCGSLIQIPGAPNTFYSVDHLLIGTNIDQGIIAASQSSRVILDASLTLTSLANNGQAVPCIPNTLTDISLFQNLYLSVYPIPGENCASYSSVITAPVPIQTCLPASQLPPLFLQPNITAITVYVSGATVTVVPFQTLACSGPGPSNQSYTLGCGIGANILLPIYWFRVLDTQQQQQ